MTEILTLCTVIKTLLLKNCYYIQLSSENGGIYVIGSVWNSLCNSSERGPNCVVEEWGGKVLNDLK